MIDVAVVGGINLDLVISVSNIPRPGETVSHASADHHPGGKGANQAVAASRAGAVVTLLGTVGQDKAGDSLIESLVEANVICTDIGRSKEAATGTAFITVDSSGANTVAVAEGANFAIRPQDVSAAMAKQNPAVVVAQLELPDETVRSAFRSCRAGTLRILNASPVDQQALIPFDEVDLLIVNEIEASTLLGAEVTVPTAPDAARTLASRVHRGCVLTLGSSGVVANINHQTHHLAAHHINVVDTTGAGDAFCGAMAAALAREESMPSALAWGNAAGALATTRAGAQPSMPHRDEIATLLSAEAR